MTDTPITANTITLPIRCSTVKKANPILQNIIWYEFWITIISLFAYGFGFRFWMITTSYAIQCVELVGATIICIAVFCGGVVLLFYVCDYIISKLPTFDCIKDEGDED